MVIVLLKLLSTGKTLFLYYLLVLRLLYGLPTAFQHERDLLVFDDAGVYLIRDSTTLSRLFHGEYFPIGLWCLIDINCNLVSPPEIFSSEQSPLFIVQASSPRMIRHDYAARKHHAVYTMKPFSLKELHYGSDFSDPSLLYFSQSHLQT